MQRMRIRRVLATAGVVVFLAGAAACTAAPTTSTTQAPTSAAAESTESTQSPSATTTGEPGIGPECPEVNCFTVMVTGDMLFHEGLWKNFAIDAKTHDGENFDFDPLFAGQSDYIKQSDLAICHLETPVAKKGGPYSDYPIFNIPPEVVTAIKAVGYDACSTASNHALDQGTAGIERTLKTLDAAGLQHTGSYASESDSGSALVLSASGGKVALIQGTASLNGFVADESWQVDRFREGSAGEEDIAAAIAKAKKARADGADVVMGAIHSLQEYLTTADSYQIATAHEMADSGQFDVIYGHGCHCAQPIEYYKGTWIVYGLGNTVTESAGDVSRAVNDQGLTVRFQFAGDAAGSWKVSDVAWVASYNKQGSKYRWCSLGSDEPQGTCVSSSRDAAMRERVQKIVNSEGAVSKGLHEWLVTQE